MNEDSSTAPKTPARRKKEPSGGTYSHPASWSKGKKAKRKKLRLIREGRWKR